MVLKTGTTESPAKRVDHPVEGRTLFEQDPAAFDGLVGTYEEAPDFVFSVRREGERLLVAVTGQAELEVFPVAQDRFTYFEVEAELSFVRGADGRATGMKRYLGGGVAPSKRVN